MSDLVIPLEIAGGVVLLVVLVLVFFIGRRVALTRRLGTFDCALRKPTPDGEGRWAFGVARYEHNRLDWFRTFAVSPFPRRRFARAKLIILERREPGSAEAHVTTRGSVIVRCRYGSGGTIELAMSELAYSGFSTWLESAPPGLLGAYS